MSAQITHELRNPLSSIALNAELIEEDLRRLDDADVGEALTLLQAIGREVDRLTDVTEQYLRFARLPKPELEEEDVNGVIEGLLSFMAEELAARGVRVEKTLAPLPPVPIDENQIRQALMNIVRNASEAISETRRAGIIRVRTACGPSEVRIEIEDTGPGMTADVRSKIFDPFFSAKRGGTGLGLALVHQIVAEHHGEVTCVSEPGAGARFTLTLPLDATATRGEADA
jgi:signal transduction histidine kinase